MNPWVHTILIAAFIGVCAFILAVLLMVLMLRDDGACDLCGGAGEIPSADVTDISDIDCPRCGGTGLAPKPDDRPNVHND